MTIATARKTSLKINTSPIVTIFDCPILFAFYIVGKVRYKGIGVRYVKVVIKSVNEVLSRCCFAKDGTDLFISACRTYSTLIFTRSTSQILREL